MPAEVVFSSTLKDNRSGPRSFRRFDVALPGMAWRESLAPSPALADKNLKLATRITIANMSLTGLFFVSGTCFPKGTRLWVGIRIGDQMLQLPAQVRRVVAGTSVECPAFGCGVQFLRGTQMVDALPIIAEYLQNHEVARAA